jgi:hypothetical protein
VERPTCGTCPYWESWDEGEDGGGACRRYPPVLPPTAAHVEARSKHNDPGEALSMGWAVATTEGEWCGEHPDMAVYLAWIKRNRALEILAAESVAE